MLLKRYPNNPILSKNPSVDWESGSVFNPNVLYKNGVFHMFYRATNDIKKNKGGGYLSSVGYATSADGINFQRKDKPLIYPTEKYEMGLGCEDPRVIFIGNEYYIFYTAVEGFGRNKKVRIALATSSDLKVIEKHGIVGPKGSTSKAATLFPEKVNGKYLMLYTWESDRPQSTIMSIGFDSLKEIKNPSKNIFGKNLEFYDDNYLLQPLYNSRRGPEVGAPPIKTSEGWLLIFCGAAVNKKIWTIDAMLLDLKNPKKILGYSPSPVLFPKSKEDLHGVVNNVTFPSGAVIVGDELYIYYGSGDQGCCLATCKKDKLIDYLMDNPPSKKILGSQYYRQLLYK